MTTDPIILDIHRMVGNIEGRMTRLEIQSDKHEPRIKRIENVVRVWPKKHADQLRVGTMIVAFFTVIGSVIGFLAQISPAIATVFK